MTRRPSRGAVGAFRTMGCTPIGGPGVATTPSRALPWLYAVALAGAPLFAVADGVLTPYAAEDIEHNTNVFDLSSVDGRPIGKHGPTLADTFFEERAGLDGTYLIDQQKFFGTAEFRHFNYENFTVLDHNEELFDGGLKWKLTAPLDGQIEYRHEQRMVQFQDLQAATQLILETENTATAAANVNVTPEWRWENLFKDHELDSPRVEVPGLSVHEDSLEEGFKYIGVSNLSAGLQLQYLDGKYNHDPLALNPYYHQVSAGVAATYIISGLTNFTGELGYTHRSDPTTLGLGGITGRIGYVHNYTPKTSLTLQATRALNTYVTTGGNEIDTSAGGTIDYQATYKILIRGGYTYTHSVYPGQPVGDGTIDRREHLQTANVDLTYQVLHWLSIRPYVRYQTRHSNETIFTFDGTIIGVELLAKQVPLTR